MMTSMPSRLRLSLVAFAVALVAVACGSESQSVESAEDSSLVAATASGGQIDFGSLEGTDTVLWFWAPW